MGIKCYLMAALAALAVNSASADNPKREFRGAWMHTVHQGQYARQTTEQCKQYLRDQLDRLQRAGVNAVFFQVRPSADALYDSKLEPWSRFLTSGGKAPSPYWDPLAFMCAEAHARGMELHAWLNPYRVTTTKDEAPVPGHLYYKHPGRFVRYEGDGKLYFDPALAENRRHIVAVVQDICTRYDIDGIHFDDYFYPYPAKGKDFEDATSYARLGAGMDKADWRRHNVDCLIREVHTAIRHSPRPWVRFGVSPFGIWRNKSTDPRGSDTSGLQNYDDLYADPLLWAQEGWIDYLMPQLYWELDHARASTRVLAPWWDAAVGGSCQLYFGQDVKKMLDTPDTSGAPDEMDTKIAISRSLPHVQGNCWWPAYVITADYKGVASRLARGAQSTPALVPEYPALADGTPAKVEGVRITDGRLSWKRRQPQGRVSDHVKYVVYRFDRGVMPDFDDPTAIVAVTADTSMPVTARGFYYVTALDHANTESAPSSPVKFSGATN